MKNPFIDFQYKLGVSRWQPVLRVRALLFFSVLLLTCVGQLPAQELQFSNRISGIDILPGATLYTSDDLFPTDLSNPNWDADLKIYQARSLVMLGIDRLSLDMENVDVDAEVEVGITVYDRNFAQTSWRDTLSVHYDGDQLGESEQVVDYRLREGSHYAIVSVVGVTVNGVAAVPDFIYLENRIAVDRSYENWDYHAGDTLSLEHDFLDEQKELEVRWPFVPGAEEYEVEWTFVHTIDGRDVNSGITANLEFDFEKNATRIQTSMNFYRIPMLYEAGYLMYRVRSVHTLRQGDMTHRLASNWTWNPYDPDQDGQGPLSDALGQLGNNRHIYYYQGHHPTLAWQASSTFAEEGKRVSTINYFDGSMRTRQSAAKNNADSLVVVSETFYDYSGRPAVQALPVPALKYNPQLSFKGGAFGGAPGDGFNRNTNGKPYDRASFDPDNIDCEVSAAPMSDNNGAGYYFSNASIGEYSGGGNYAADATHQHWKSQLNIPDAGGYPFVQTTYTPDGTGRVASQSAVGPTHRLGAGHETRYFYGSAEKEDLDKLFGSEVGYAEHYRKNMVVDANGQVSVSYLDGGGNTIATALAGETPDSLIGLGDNVLQEDLRKDLLQRNRKPLEEGILLSTTDFLVTSAGVQEFEYQVLEHSFADSCMVPKCYDCIYDLEISVIDDCGNERLVNGPIETKVFGPELNTACSQTPNGFEMDELTDQLEVGHYMVVKRLKVNREAMEFYLDDYLEGNKCLKDLGDFLAVEMADLDTSGCHLTCDSCQAGVSMYDNFQDFQDACAANCETDDACGALYQAMLTDVSPGGQYAQYTFQGGQMVAASGVSVYGVPGGTKQLYAWPTYSGPPYLQPSSNPTGAGYDPASIMVDGVLTAVTALGFDDYILNFDPNWAEALVAYHPEYCYYEYCSGFSLGDNYWLELYEMETFAEADASGKLSSLDSLNIHADPFYVAIGNNFTTNYQALFETWLNDFVLVNGVTYSIYEAVVAMHRCPTTAPVCAGQWGTPAITLDDEWRTFVLAYRGVQERMKAHIYKNDASLSNCRSRADLPGTTGDWEDYISYHPDLNDVLGVDFNSPTLVTDVSNAANAQLAAHCGEMCEAYRPTWQRLIEACLSPTELTAVSAQMTAILDDFEGLCALGCDFNNAFGSSTTPSGVPYVAHGQNFYSFEEVLNYYNTTYSLSLSSSTLPCLEYLLDVPMPYDHPSAFEEGCAGELVGYWDPDEIDWNFPCNTLGDFSSSSSYLAAHTLNQCGSPAGHFPTLNYSPCTNTCPPNAPCTTFMGDYADDPVGSAWDPLSYDLNNLSGTVPLVGNGMVAPVHDAACIWPGTANEGTAVGRDIDPNGIFIAVRGAVTRSGNTNVDFGSQHSPAKLTVASPSVLNCPIVNGERYEISLRVINLSPNTANYQSNPNYAPQLGLERVGGGVIGSPQVLLVAPFQWTTLKWNWTADITNNAISFNIINYLQSFYGNDFGFDRLEVRRLDCCLDCAEMTTVYADFVTETGANPSTESNFWEMLTGYANQTLSYNLTATDYADFYSNCQAQSGVHVINDPGDVVADENAVGYRLAQYFGTGITIKDTAGNSTEYELDDYVVQFLRGGISVTTEPLMLCNVPLSASAVNPCVQAALDRAGFDAQENYEAYIDSVKNDFRERYTSECLQAEERFERIHGESEYQYTLYYYDNTGSLVQTVPPEGVEKVIDQPKLDNAAAYRDYYASLFTDNPISPAPLAEDPHHGLPTRYFYTSLNGIWKSTTPDKGETRTWFDNLGRAVFSQDARQKVQESPNSLYTYTEFDALSRPVELGEALSSTNVNTSVAFLYNPTVNGILANPTRQDITYTWYDEAQFALPAFASENSRNRVTHTARADAPGNYTHLNHYSYDEHGNVDHLVVEIPELAAYNQDKKHLYYTYDLISGNVDRFSYQTGEADAWHHQYWYDANNRLRVAETSRDGILWEKDEKAFYYLHGSRMRSEIGEEKVQGCDYAHTIQGWTRGVNSGTLDESLDMGLDGNSTGVNRYIARDDWGFELGFFEGDYSPIGGLSNQWYSGVDASLATEVKNLYNGNIAYQVIANRKLMEMGTGIYTEPLFKRYRYDQLNRIKSMDLFYDPNGLSDNTWSAGTAMTTDYHTDYSFDRNGNLTELNRYAANNQRMDRLEYHYNTNLGGELQNNMLKHVNDLQGQVFAGIDLPDQGPVASPNYAYDPTGNLISDVSEEVGEIVWDLYGKIVEVNRNSGSTRDELSFGYDAGGNRVRKTVIPNAGTPEIQYYVRDPQGNVLGIYKFWNDNAENVVDLEELHIYGSERLGIHREVVRLAEGTYTANNPVDGQKVVNSVGEKAIVISGLRYTSPFYSGDKGKIVILENVSNRTIEMTNLSLTDPNSAQAYALPEVFLDSGERLAVVNGELNAGEVDLYYGLSGGLTDTSLHFVFQEGFALDAEGGVLALTLTESDDAERILDEVVYGAAGAEASFGEGLVRTWYTTTTSDFDAAAYVGGEPFAGGSLEKKGYSKGLGAASEDAQVRGLKLYELRDHLGNVTVVVSDRALPVDDAGVAGLSVAYFRGQVKSARDFYPYGMVMVGRRFDTPAYRYGFQGQEGDDELFGEGNSASYKYRVTDSRLGRFLSIDPLAPEFPWNSTYSFSENRVLDGLELEGLERFSVHLYQEEFGSSVAYIQIIDSRIVEKSSTGILIQWFYYDEKGNSVEMEGSPTKSFKLVSTDVIQDWWEDNIHEFEGGRWYFNGIPISEYLIWEEDWQEKKLTPSVTKITPVFKNFDSRGEGMYLNGMTGDIGDPTGSLDQALDDIARQVKENVGFVSQVEIEFKFLKKDWQRNNNQGGPNGQDKSTICKMGLPKVQGILRDKGIPKSVNIKLLTTVYTKDEDFFVKKSGESGLIINIIPK